MKIPFFPAIATHDVSGTINIALHELGLTENYLANVLRGLHVSVHLNQTGEIDFNKMDVNTWVLVCRLLHLPLDCFTGGYMRMTHVHWIGTAIQEGKFLLPRTKPLEHLFQDFLAKKRASIRYEAEHLGDRLRKRAKDKRYTDAARLRKERKQSMRRNSLARQFLMHCFINGAASRPLRIKLAKSQKTGNLSLPGLTTIFLNDRTIEKNNLRLALEESEMKLSFWKG